MKSMQAVFFAATLTFAFATEAWAKEMKLNFKNWQKISSARKSAADQTTKTDVYQRDIHFLNDRYSVGVLVHTQINKKTPAQRVNIEDVEHYLIYGMDLTHVKHRTVGRAHVVEGFWEKGHRYYRLYTQETNSRVDVALFSVRSLYINNVALEGEYLQRYLTGNMKKSNFASLLKNVSEMIVPEAVAQTSCPAGQEALCAAAGATTGGTDDMAALAASNQQLAQALTAVSDTASQSTTQVAGAVSQANLPSLTNALNNIASSVTGTDKVIANSTSVVKLSESSAAVIATGVITAGVVNGGIMLAGKALSYLIDATTGRRDKAAILEAYNTARDSFTDTRNKSYQLEKLIDSNLVLKQFMEKYNWNVEDALSDLEKQYLREKQKAKSIEASLGDKDPDKCPECDAQLSAEAKSNANADELKGQIDAFEKIRASGLFDEQGNHVGNRAQFCANVRGDLRAVVNAEVTLQQYRSTFLAAAAVPFQEASDTLDKAKVFNKYSGDTHAVDKACAKTEKKIKQVDTAGLNHQEKQFKKTCESDIKKLPSFGDWKKNYSSLAAKDSIADFVGPNGFPVKELGADRSSYHKYVCDKTLNSSFDVPVLGDTANGWLKDCYAELDSHWFMHASKMCEGAFAAYEKAIHDKPAVTESGDVSVCDDIKTQRMAAPAINNTTTPIDTSIIELSLKNQTTFMQETQNEMRCYEDGVGCPGGISKKTELKDRDKNVAAICPLTETGAAGAKSQTNDTK